MRLTIPAQELVSGGHIACQGCGATLAMRYVLKALGKKTMLTVAASCWSVLDGAFPNTSVSVPLFHTAFETAASTASGIKNGLESLGKSDITVVAWAGDGGTFDIGLQAISGAAERNEDIIYVCYDNEAYMNTGVQRSSATPYKTITTTTPKNHPKDKNKKDIDAILVAHGVPYVATASVAYPEDLIKKVEKAKNIKGFRFIHILAPCPPGWKVPSDKTIQMARLAVQCGIYPLFEVENGKYRITKKKITKDIAEYLKAQGRFSAIKNEDMDFIRKITMERWDRLLEKENMK